MTDENTEKYAAICAEVEKMDLEGIRILYKFVRERMAKLKLEKGIKPFEKCEVCNCRTKNIRKDGSTICYTCERKKKTQAKSTETIEANANGQGNRGEGG